MPVRIIFRRTDDAGNVYYTDGDGQIIDKPEEENEYVGCFRTPEYEDYINSLTEEDLARQRAEGEARYYAQVAERERKAKGLAVKDLTKLGGPKARKMLWKNYWAERELCILAGDNGVGKSLLALKIARELALTDPHPAPLPKGEGVNPSSFDDSQNTLPLSREIINTTSPLRGTPPTLGGELDTFGENDNTSPSGDAPLQSSPLSAVADVPPACGRQASEGDIFSPKVLYVDFEMEEEDFVVRFGNDIPENFTWVGLNAEGEMPPDFKNKTEWLLQNFTTTIEDTEAKVVIVDQPDRLSLSPQKWLTFLANLKSIMRKKGLSVMLIVSNKPRHIGRPCGLNNIPKGNILIPEADSIVMLAQNNRHAEGRYLKVLKNRNRRQAEDLELVDVLSINENDGYLDVEYFGAEPEKHMLPPNAAERKNRLIMKAEKLWDEGLCYMEIAERMELPEGLVKRWLEPHPPTPSPLERGSYNNTTSPRHRRSTPPTLGGEENPSSFDASQKTLPSEREIQNTPSPSAFALGTPPLQGESYTNTQILLQQQGFERVKVRVSMP